MDKKINEAWRAFAAIENDYEKLMDCIGEIVADDDRNNKVLTLHDINGFWIEFIHFVRCTILNPIPDQE